METIFKDGNYMIGHDSQNYGDVTITSIQDERVTSITIPIDVVMRLIYQVHLKIGKAIIEESAANAIHLSEVKVQPCDCGAGPNELCISGGQRIKIMHRQRWVSVAQLRADKCVEFDLAEDAKIAWRKTNNAKRGDQIRMPRVAGGSVRLVTV